MLTLSLDSQAATLVAGGKLADGVQLEATLKQLVDLLNKEEPEIAKGIKLNTETYDAVRLSTFSIPLEGLPLPEDLKEILGKLFGKQFEAIVGIGDKSAYLAAGRNPARMLKSVMDANKKESGKVIPPFQLSVDALSIAKFTAAVATEEDAKRRAEILVKALAPSPAKSHLTVTSLAIPNGVKIRLEVQEGILRLLGSIPTLIGFPSEGAHQPRAYLPDMPKSSANSFTRASRTSAASNPSANKNEFPHFAEPAVPGYPESRRRPLRGLGIGFARWIETAVPS